MIPWFPCSWCCAMCGISFMSSTIWSGPMSCREREGMALSPLQIGVRSINFYEQCFQTPYDVTRVQDTMTAVTPIMNDCYCHKSFLQPPYQINHTTPKRKSQCRTWYAIHHSQGINQRHTAHKFGSMSSQRKYGSEISKLADWTSGGSLMRALWGVNDSALKSVDLTI